ncbi:hypothetical protein F4777DRAFT_577809 [Nemania sp. FL0916]|nr:hypothetical protein F4777DRAFT_577809 [Nemania sp. FL0916]
MQARTQSIAAAVMALFATVNSHAISRNPSAHGFVGFETGVFARDATPSSSASSGGGFDITSASSSAAATATASSAVGPSSASTLVTITIATSAIQVTPITTSSSVPSSTSGSGSTNVSTTPTSSYSAPSGTSSSTPSGSSGSGSGSTSGGLTGKCTAEGMYNCLDGTSYQQCASGQWSVIMQMPATTKCAIGQTMTLWARSLRSEKKYLLKGLRRGY